MRAAAVVVQTHTNEAPRWLSKYHGAQPIFVCTDAEKIVHQLDGYYRACHAIQIDHEMTSEELVHAIREQGYELDSGVCVIVNDWNEKICISDLVL